MKRIILFLLRKHWVRPVIKRENVRFLSVDGKPLSCKASLRRVTIHRDFSELYFFPRLAAKLVAPKHLGVSVEISDYGKERMFFQG